MSPKKCTPVIVMACILFPVVAFGNDSFQQCITNHPTLNRVPLQDDVDAWMNWCDFNTRTLIDNTVNDIWSNYNVHSNDWDDGWGYNNPCDIVLPMSRVINAYAQIDYAGTQSRKLENMAFVASQNINAVHPSCDNKSNGSALWSPFKYNIYYTLKFFFGIRDVASRATTIIHEAHHAQNRPHMFPSLCANGASCDYSWGDGGANTEEVLWSFEVIDNNALYTDPGGCGPRYDDLVDDAEYNLDFRFFMPVDFIQTTPTCPSQPAVPWNLNEPEPEGNLEPVVFNLDFSSHTELIYAPWESVPFIKVLPWSPQ